MNLDLTDDFPFDMELRMKFMRKMTFIIYRLRTIFRFFR